jgi:hypothetical protein
MGSLHGQNPIGGLAPLTAPGEFPPRVDDLVDHGNAQTPVAPRRRREGVKSKWGEASLALDTGLAAGMIQIEDQPTVD